jgi:hypothetical protein
LIGPQNVVADRGDGLALGRMSGLRVCPRVASMNSMQFRVADLGDVVAASRSASLFARIRGVAVRVVGRG